MRPVEKQLQQMSLTKTQQMSIPSRVSLDQPVKQLSVPTDKLVRPRSESPAVANKSPRTNLQVTTAARQPSPLSRVATGESAPNPFGDCNDDGGDESAKNPFGDPDDEDYDDNLNPFAD